MMGNKKLYVLLFISLLITVLVIADGTPTPVALVTVALPILAGYWLIVRFGNLGLVFVPILWALAFLAREFLMGTVTQETLRAAGLKAFGSVILAVAYIALGRKGKNREEEAINAGQ
ncbi:hypothetical protein [Thermococcus barossii]|uniref:Permease n=1 Tax=Thermococcus barossii TaxID=54077 RepID=A0A2Z2MIK5_9EURY|nr:hypothetical protein [Thermococcus barossii]ASJ04592.1 hypothetical protein A3L01_04110 [Thermococcus barossii]